MSVAAILGKKLGMTQVFDAAGAAVPVTVVQAGPCAVLEVRTAQRHGYNALQLGFEDAKVVGVEKRRPGAEGRGLRRTSVRRRGATLAAIGHAAKAETAPKRFIREIRLAAPPEAEIGQTLDVTVFDGVSHVDVVGVSKGKGYAGVMKRHHFGGQPASHGTERKHRSPGSIGGHGTDLGHGGNIKKGKRMSGRMGNDRCTLANLELVSVDPENHLMVIKGSVPGANGGYLMIRKARSLAGGRLAARLAAAERAAAEAASGKKKKK